MLFSNGLGFAKVFSHKVVNESFRGAIQDKASRCHWKNRCVGTGITNCRRLDSKKDIRLCVDFCKPNEAVVVDSHPLPHTEELFLGLANVNYSSKLDLPSVYHQLKLAEESRILTAFMTYEGLLPYTRLCFELASAAATFHKMLSMVLKGCKDTLHYLGNILVHGRTLQEHDSKLMAVLHKLRDTSPKLNAKKCIFQVKGLRFLGHVISSSSTKSADR